jgi:hypothetical protein
MILVSVSLRTRNVYGDLAAESGSVDQTLNVDGSLRNSDRG